MGKKIKTPRALRARGVFCRAGPRGLEPRPLVLETSILPLNYRPVSPFWASGLIVGEMSDLVKFWLYRKSTFLSELFYEAKKSRTSFSARSKSTGKSSQTMLWSFFSQVCWRLANWRFLVRSMGSKSS